MKEGKEENNALMRKNGKRREGRKKGAHAGAEGFRYLYWEV